MKRAPLKYTRMKHLRLSKICRVDDLDIAVVASGLIVRFDNRRQNFRTFYDNVFMSFDFYLQYNSM